MKVHFYSFSNGDKLDYISDLKYVNGMYEFDDKSDENTKIKFKVTEENKLIFNRFGNTITNILFDKENITLAHYENNMGLDFNFTVKTTRLEISEAKIIVEYDFYIDGQFQDSIKIYLLLK